MLIKWAVKHEMDSESLVHLPAPTLEGDQQHLPASKKKLMEIYILYNYPFSMINKCVIQARWMQFTRCW